MALASLAFGILTPPDTALLAALTLVSTTCLIAGIIFYFRFTSFRRMQDDLLSKKASRASAPTKGSRALVVLGGLAFLLGPLLTAGLLPPIIWLVSLGAVMYGINIAELSLTLIARKWMKRNGLKLTRYEIWSTDQFGQGTLRERGVRAERP